MDAESINRAKAAGFSDQELPSFDVTGDAAVKGQRMAAAGFTEAEIAAELKTSKGASKYPPGESLVQGHPPTAGEMFPEQQLTQGLPKWKYAVSDVARPLLEYGGMTAGALPGLVGGGPIAAFAGGAGGYAGGKGMADQLDYALGRKKPKSLAGETAKTASDLKTGAYLQGGGQILGAIPGALKGVVGAGGKKIDTAVVDSLSKTWGIPVTAGERMGAPELQRIESVAERIPLSGMTRFREGQQQAVHNASKKYLAEYIAKPNAPDAMEGNREFVNNLYEQMKKLVADVPNQAIVPEKTKPIAEDLLKRYPDTFKKLQDKQTEGYINNIVESLPDKVTAQQVTKELPFKPVVDKPTPGGGYFVKTGPNKYFESHGAPVNYRTAEEAQKVAETLSSKGAPTTEYTRAPKTLTFDQAWELRKGLGDKIAQAKLQLARGDVDRTAYAQLKSMHKAISDDMDKWADSIGRKDISTQFKAANEAYKQYVVRYDVLSRAYDKSIREVGGDVFFSPQKFSNVLDGIVKKDKYLGTFTKQERDEMAGVANIMQVATRAGKFMENVPTGNRFLDFWLLKAAVKTAEIPLGWLATALTTTEPGQKLVMKAATLSPYSEGMANIIEQLYYASGTAALQPGQRKGQ